MTVVSKTFRVAGKMAEAAVSKDPIEFISFYIKAGTITLSLALLSSLF